jgi:hypothetical protein
MMTYMADYTHFDWPNREISLVFSYILCVPPLSRDALDYALLCRTMEMQER